MEEPIIETPIEAVKNEPVVEIPQEELFTSIPESSISNVTNQDNESEQYNEIEQSNEETITEKGSEYYIEEKNVMLLFNNKSRVDELVKRALPKTGGEKQILLIWNKMKKENVKAINSQIPAIEGLEKEQNNELNREEHKYAQIAIGTEISAIKSINQEEAKITQAELADRAHYSHEFIRRIEAPNGKKYFSVDTLVQISNVLNIKLEDLVKGIGDEDK